MTETGTVIGLDVGRNSAVAAALETFPPNVLAFFKENRQKIVKIKPDLNGFQYLNSLNPTTLVMEPTGVWYSAIWHQWAKSQNVKVLWVGHADLKAQRGHYGFRNKRDPEDALTLACCALDDRFVDTHGKPRFLQFDDGEVGRLRKLCLQDEQLSKLRTQVINQIRQRLALEWPEASETAFQIGPKGYSPVPGFVAGINTSTRIKNRRAQSVAVSQGLEFDQYTIDHCKALVTLEQRIVAVRAEMVKVCQTPSLLPYYQVLTNFGFGPGLAPLMLTQVYPFSQFLVDGKPVIEWEQNAKGDWQKRNRSLRSFQAYLGMAYKMAQSGDKLIKKFSGSSLIRSHLYIWAISQMSGKGTSFKTNTSQGKELDAKLKKLASGGVTGSDKIIRFMFKVTERLWSELLKANL